MCKHQIQIALKGQPFHSIVFHIRDFDSPKKKEKKRIQVNFEVDMEYVRHSLILLPFLTILLFGNQTKIFGIYFTILIYREKSLISTYLPTYKKIEFEFEL